MLTKQGAKIVALQAFPDAKIEAVIDYNDLYVLQMFVPNPLETLWDPFYSVHKETGEFLDFSIIEDGNMSQILDSIEKEKEVTNGSRQ